MKVVITLIFCVVCLVSFSQDQHLKLKPHHIGCDSSTVYIDKDSYQICYSQFFESPITVTFKLYKPVHRVDRGDLGFHAEPGIKTSKAADYTDNEFDKGHMASAESFSDTEEHQKSTFTYANSALQNHFLNIGVWRSLEMYERTLAQDDSVLVINEVIFTKPYHQLKSGAYIPDHFLKHIISLSTGKQITWQFPNTKPKKGATINDYQLR